MPIDGSGNYTRSNGSYSGANLWQQRASAPNPKIDASEHDAEMNDVADALSACLKANGSKSPTANLPMGNFKHTGCANATNSDEYATLGQINSIVPVASITAYAGATAPTNWLLCDGSAVSRTTYASLFTIIGTVYGAGDGSTTFNLPNLSQRFPLGKASSGTGATLGGTGGAIDHTHTGGSHTHTMGNHTHTLTHTHGAGSLRALVGTESTSVQKISFLLDPAVTFGKTSGATYNGTHQTVAYPGYTYATGVDASVAVPSSYVLGTTDGASTSTTSTPSTNTSDAGGAVATTSNNPPYLVINYIIKY
jgi:microcystin-dependent protein